MEIGKIKRVEAKNFKKLRKFKVDLTKNINIFWGDINQGKSSVLQVLETLLTRGNKDGIISNGATNCYLKLTFDNGYIERFFYKIGNKTVPRKLKINFDGKDYTIKDLSENVSELALNENYFKNLNSPEKNRFLLDVLEVDTSDIDKKIKQQISIVKDNEICVKSFGNIVLKEIKKPNIELAEENLQKEKDKLNTNYKKEKEENNILKINWQNEKKEIDENYTLELKKLKEKENLDYNKKLSEYETRKEYIRIYTENFNQTQRKLANKENKLIILYNEIKNKIAGTDFERCFDYEKAKDIINELPEPKKEKVFSEEMKKLIKPRLPNTTLEKDSYPDEPTYNNMHTPENADTTKKDKLAEEVINQKLQQKDYENFLIQKSKYNSQQAYLKEIEKSKNKIKELKKEKKKKLYGYSNKIENLTFTEDGVPMYRDSQLQNLNTAGLIELNTILVKLMPKNKLNILLIDRAESLNLGNKENLGVYLRKAKEDNTIFFMSIVSHEIPVLATQNIDVHEIINGKIIN